eukprot:4453805-Amphidinium_carterae.1
MDAAPASRRPSASMEPCSTQTISGMISQLGRSTCSTQTCSTWAPLSRPAPPDVTEEGVAQEVARIEATIGGCHRQHLQSPSATGVDSHLRSCSTSIGGHLHTSSQQSAPASGGGESVFGSCECSTSCSRKKWVCAPRGNSSQTLLFFAKTSPCHACSSQTQSRTCLLTCAPGAAEGSLLHGSHALSRADAALLPLTRPTPRIGGASQANVRCKHLKSIGCLKYFMKIKENAMGWKYLVYQPANRFSFGHWDMFFMLCSHSPEYGVSMRTKTTLRTHPTICYYLINKIFVNIQCALEGKGNAFGT